MKHKKGRYGFYYNNPYDIAGKALEIPLNTTAGYAQGVLTGQGLGLDNKGQRTLGTMSAINTGLNSTASLIQTIRRNKEERERTSKEFANEYYKVPYDRYSYQENLNDPYQPNAFKSGGRVNKKYENGGLPVSNLGQYEFPGQAVRVPTDKITMKGLTDPLLGISNNGQVQLMQPGEEYNFKGAQYVDEYPMKWRGKKYQAGGVYDSTSSVEIVSQEGEDVIFDATSPTQVSQPMMNLEPKNLDTFDYQAFNPQPFYQPSENIPMKGSIAVSHNNPGNIKFGKFASGYGARVGRYSTEKDGSRFAVFPDVQTGLKAQRDLLVSKNYRNLSVDAAMKRWSNNGYGAEIYPEVIGKKMGELSDQELQELQKRQIKREDINMYKRIYS